MSYLSDLRTVTFTDDQGRTRQAVGGSFRGVPFFVASHQFGTGRRIAVHEYPNLDDPFNEDMGRVSRSVSLEAYLLGEDVRAQLERILQAMEREGAGSLVHPYLGTKTARCTACQVQESATEKRRVGLSLSFVLDPDIRPTPVVLTDARSAAQLAAKSAKSATASRFARVFTLAKASAATVDAAVKTTEHLLDQVATARESMRQAAAYVSKLGQIRQNLALLLMAPGDFAARVQDLLTTAEDAVLPSGTSSTRRVTYATTGSTAVVASPDPSSLLARVQLSEALAMSQAGADLAVVPNQTASERRLQASNQRELVALFQQSATFDLAEKLIGAKITSVDDASDLQNSVDAAFENVLSTTEDPEVYQLSQDAQAAALSYLRETSADLAVVLTTTPARTVPSLVLSFEVYGTHTRADDIVARNGIQHPGFLPGGQPLEILSR